MHGMNELICDIHWQDTKYLQHKNIVNVTNELQRGFGASQFNALEQFKGNETSANLGQNVRQQLAR